MTQYFFGTFSLDGDIAFTSLAIYFLRVPLQFHRARNKRASPKHGLEVLFFHYSSNASPWRWSTSGLIFRLSLFFPLPLFFYCFLFQRGQKLAPGMEHTGDEDSVVRLATLSGENPGGDGRVMLD